MVDESGSYNNRTLAGMAFGLGALLKQRTGRDSVGLLLPAGVGFVAGFYGTLLANKIVVPINFLLGAKEVAHIVADSGVDTVLTVGPLAGRLEGTGVKTIDMAGLAGQLPPPARSTCRTPTRTTSPRCSTPAAPAACPRACS